MSTIALPTTDIRRDQWGRYLVVQPGHTTPVGYSRVTTVAKILDSGGGLAPWKATMTATGMILRRGLRARWEALLAEHGDPWYDGADSKKACKALVEDCAAAGGANDRKEMGSSLHSLTAIIDAGGSLGRMTDETERDLDAYVKGLAAYNVTVVPDLIETVIVLDDYEVAGTFDRVVRVPGFDKPLIADLKTGENLEYSWQTIAVQLAAYSRGDAVYRQGAAKDGSQDQRLPMPEVDQEFAVVLWLKAGKAELEVWLVDLMKGWEAFEHSLWVRDWQKYAPAAPFTGLPLVANPGNAAALLRQSIAVAKAEPAPGVAINLTPDEDDGLNPIDPLPESDADLPPIDAYRDWLQLRIDVIGLDPDARSELGRQWPENVPSLRASTEHPPEQLSLIEEALVNVEAKFRIPFPPERPGVEATIMAEVRDLFPGAIDADERPWPDQD